MLEKLNKRCMWHIKENLNFHVNYKRQLLILEFKNIVSENRRPIKWYSRFEHDFLISIQRQFAP